MTNLVVVSIKMEPELLEKLDKWARFKGVSRSQLVREALTHYLQLLNDLYEKEFKLWEKEQREKKTIFESRRLRIVSVG